MKKIFFAMTICILLMLISTGAAAEGMWITIDQQQNETLGMPYVISGTTNFPEGKILTINVTSGDNLTKESREAIVRLGEDGVNVWNVTCNLWEFSPDICTVLVTGDASTSARTAVFKPQAWIKIDPIPFVAEKMNLTITGKTNIPAGQMLLVEVINIYATCCGTNNEISGQSLITTIQNGDNGVQTWNVTMATTGWTPDPHAVKVTAIEVDVTALETVLLYPAGYTTPGPTEIPTKKHTGNHVAAQTPKASGFAIITVLIAGAAVLILMRKQ